MTLLRLVIPSLLLCLAGCGVQGSLYLPEKVDANAPPAAQSAQKQVLPVREKTPRPSVQTGDLEEEMGNDPFLTVNPDGEYDIRGQRGINP